MFVFKATQFYKVELEDKTIKFDYFGEFKTSDEEIAEALKKLAPTYVQLVEEPKKKVEPKVEAKEVQAEAEPKEKRKSTKK